MIEQIEAAIVALALSPWGLVVLFACCVIDGFFPPVPSESAVVAIAALSVTGNGPSIWAIMAVAAAGALCGDLIAFAIGRRVPVHSMRIFAGPRGKRTLSWVEHQLQRRGATLILSARYIPVGRVAVNMSAGAARIPALRFALVAAIAATSWAIVSTLIGILAGALAGDYPLLGVVIGIVIGIVIGLVVDAIVRRRARGLDDDPPRS